MSAHAGDIETFIEVGFDLDGKKVVTRRLDPSLSWQPRLGAICHGRLVGDLRARSVVHGVDIDAPKEGRPTTKVNWLVRQLKQANDRARLECNVMNQRGNGASDLLGRVRENPDLLILDPTKSIRSFTVALNSPMGLKSGRGQGTFIDGLLAAIDTFYAEVLQSLKAWAAKPPRMREQTDTSELARDQEVLQRSWRPPSRPRTVQPLRKLTLCRLAAPSSLQR